MTTYSQGQVVLIPFPFTDLTTTKQRPAVIISSNAYNRTHPDLILAAITSMMSPLAFTTEIFLHAATGSQLYLKSYA
jgi:mRNA interferase MazF